jgi:hypothetical protein
MPEKHGYLWDIMGFEGGSILPAPCGETNHSFYSRVIPMVRRSGFRKLAKIIIFELF